MKINPIIIFIIVSIALLGSRCGNKDPEPEDYVRIPQDFLDYCAFPVGSWWVYEDTAGVEDSIWVARFEVTEVTEQNVSDWLKYNEQLTYQLQNKNNNFYFGADPLLSDNQNNELIYLFTQKYNQSSFTRYKFEANNNYTVGNSGFYHFDHLDDMSIGSIIFQDINVFGYHNQVDGNLIHKEYYARGIGVVQREMFDGTIWKLKKYHIEN